MKSNIDLRSAPGSRSKARLAGLAALGLLGLATVFAGAYTVDQSELGVKLRFGKIVSIEQPGGNVKIPFVEHVVKVDMQTRTMKWDKVNAYSADQQPADLHVSVTLHVDPSKVPDFYARFGGDIPTAVAASISPHVNQQVKVVFGQFTAVRAIQERARLNKEAQAAVEGAINDSPLIIESVQIESIDYSREYVRAVEARMQAEVEVQKVQQQSMREIEQAKIDRTRADVEAYKIMASAKAQAESRKLQGDAEAAAIRAKGDALKDNPALVPLVIAEKWNGALPTQMLPGNTVPFLNLAKP